MTALGNKTEHILALITGLIKSKFVMFMIQESWNHDVHDEIVTMATKGNLCNSIS